MLKSTQQSVRRGKVVLVASMGFVLVVGSLMAYTFTQLVPKNWVPLATRIKIRYASALAFFTGMLVLMINNLMDGYWVGAIALAMLTILIPAFILGVFWAEGQRSRRLQR